MRISHPGGGTNSPHSQRSDLGDLLTLNPVEHLVRPDIVANLASGVVLSLGIAVLVACWDAQNRHSREHPGARDDDADRNPR
jgi:hypothetical protein